MSVWPDIFTGRVYRLLFCRKLRGDGPLSPALPRLENPGLACSRRTAALSSADPALAPPLGTSDAPSPAGPSRSRAGSHRQGSPCIVPLSRILTPRSDRHIPASPSVNQRCPGNPTPWCWTRCASGLLRTPRPGACTSRCRGPRVSPAAARRAAATSLLSWGCSASSGLSSLAPHPRSRAAQRRDAPHPSRLGAQRADSPGPARSLARHRAVTRLPLPFSGSGDYPSDPRPQRRGGDLFRPSYSPRPESTAARTPRGVAGCNRAPPRSPRAAMIAAPARSLAQFRGPRARTRPLPPPPAPPRLSSARRCVPIPAPTSAGAPATSQVTAADEPGPALCRAPAAPSPPLLLAAPSEPRL